MSTAVKVVDLEAKVNAWLNEHGAKIDIEHTRTISGSITRDGANQSTYYAISIWYYDMQRGRGEPGNRNARGYEVSRIVAACDASLRCLSAICGMPSI